jgi:hypothetical protein
LQVWLGMSPDQRAAQTRTPVLRDRDWRME